MDILQANLLSLQQESSFKPIDPHSRYINLTFYNIGD